MDEAEAGEGRWLEPGPTCWRVETAHRFAVLMENGVYFRALASSLEKARRSVLLLGWQFDPRTRLDPETGANDHTAEIGHRLRFMVKTRPDLDVRLLIWNSPLVIAASQGFYPHAAERWFRKRFVDFRLDSPGPFGACHHQKVVVIDDRVAFSGGGDVATDRWDSDQHADDDPRRTLPSGRGFPPRHEVMCVMDGPAARSLGDLARERWRRATWEKTAPVESGGDPWPDGVEPDFHEASVGISRTEPAWRGRPSVRENEALHLDLIRKARRLIYFENQYFTSARIAEALAARLAEPEGPEVVLISTGKSPSWFDSLTMDTARSEVLFRLEQADVHDRFFAFSPRTAGGRRIIVHAKMTVIDDRVIRVGSTNLNNRSFGLDTECDVTAEPADAQGRAAIRRYRQRSIGHFIGIDAEAFAAAEALERSVGRAIRRFDAGRLDALGYTAPTRLERAVAGLKLGDPFGAEDAWRPWKRLGRAAPPPSSRA